MSTDNIDILTLIPQRPPFVMVDRLIHCDSVVTETQLLVREDNIFVDDGRLSASGLTENIAQTCAARMGYMNRCAGEAVKIGVIGAVRNLKVLQLPKAGTLLTTRIEVLEEVFQMTLVQAVVTDGSNTYATAQMKIAITDTDATD